MFHRHLTRPKKNPKLGSFLEGKPPIFQGPKSRWRWNMVPFGQKSLWWWFQSSWAKGTQTSGNKHSRPYWQKALKDQIRLKEGSEQQTCCFGVWLGVYYFLKGADMMRVGWHDDFISRIVFFFRISWIWECLFFCLCLSMLFLFSCWCCLV